MTTRPLTDFAPAKVNLTLRVMGKRADGYHELDSVVAFAACGDGLELIPGDHLAISVTGPRASAAGEDADNLVLKAARNLAARVPDLRTGAFVLDKHLPVAAGLGGGSSDAAAALRLLARLNEIALDDARIVEAAIATGADVPVCLDPRARVMRGIGEELSTPLRLMPLSAVLVNPGVAVPTRDVFVALSAGRVGAARPQAAETLEPETIAAFIQRETNDLEAPAIALQPVIATVLTELRARGCCTLARMSGSGATCFALFPTNGAASDAAVALKAAHPDWWIEATTLR